MEQDFWVKDNFPGGLILPEFLYEYRAVSKIRQGFSFLCLSEFGS
jgi:hypothetical protein